MKAIAQKNTHLQAAQSQAQTKACKRVFFSATREKLFFKISSPSENKKYPTAPPDTTKTMTLKPNTANGLQGRAERTPAANRRLAQWRVTWLIEHYTSHQLLWCIDSFVLRIENQRS